MIYFCLMKSIVLASQSPRRKQLLEWARIPFEILSHPTDESYPHDLTPENIALHIATEKAKSVAHLTDKLILAADTIVVLDNEIIGKPADLEDAVSILHRLSGRQHEVITGVAIVSGDQEMRFAEKTIVEFLPITDHDIRFYVDTCNPLDKAGAYAIQEWIGVTGIRSIQGDFYNVMGLPISRVVDVLRTHFQTPTL